MWSASLSKQMLKNKAGELKFYVFDLLNQNVNITRNVTSTGIQDVQNKLPPGGAACCSLTVVSMLIWQADPGLNQIFIKKYPYLFQTVLLLHPQTIVQHNFEVKQTFTHINLYSLNEPRPLFSIEAAFNFPQRPRRGC